VAKTASKKKGAKATGILNVAFVWDMSGSMNMVDSATREGTLSYLKDLQREERRLAKKKAGVYTRLSLTVFDTVFEQWLVNEAVADVDAQALINRYQPRGYTALYDAIANTISETAKRMRDEAREDERVMVIIMTDGGENSSREFGRGVNGRQRILELIKSYEKKGTWTFVWLGAGEAALAEAVDLGIARGNTVSYDSSFESVKAVSASLGSVTDTRRRGAAGQTVSAFADAGLGTDYTDKGKKSDKK
jgi:LmbE family N-acetylglucosaminyl deacetylase